MPLLIMLAHALVIGVVLGAALMASTPARAAQVTPDSTAPSATLQPAPGAARYRLTLRREAHRELGLDAPVALLAAQVHQESRWRADAKSPVGAVGLTQFMPATARWMGEIDAELQVAQPLSPTWAIRALVVYDTWLLARVRAANDECQAWAFALQAYNGGLRWVQQRRRASPQPGDCLAVSCRINPGVTAASQAEAQHYPVAVIGHQARYAGWGRQVCVS